MTEQTVETSGPALGQQSRESEAQLIVKAAHLWKMIMEECLKEIQWI